MGTVSSMTAAATIEESLTAAADQPPLRIGMADIGVLARVGRSAVSNWRARASGHDQPFPAPVSGDGDRPMFDGRQVARWLVETGHGNNPDAVEDLAAFATLDALSPRTERAVFDALTALLCLKVATTTPLGGRSHEELLDLADELDPDDADLLSEVTRVGDRVGPLARYADLLTDAAYRPAAAFERLLSDRFRSALSEHAAASLRPEALSLVARIAVDLGDRPGVPAAYVDSGPGSGDLLLAVVDEHGERSPVEVVTADVDDPAARLLRRRLRVHRVPRRGLHLDADGTFVLDRAVTHVAQFPTPGAPTISDRDVLAAVENLVLAMGPGQRGLVVGPAAALCERLRDRGTAAIRDSMLRAGHVHAVVRLPKGLVTARPRQALAIWLLGPADHRTPLAERVVTVADLANDPLTDDVTDSLVTDLAAATGSRALARAHAFRFTRPVPTRLLLTAPGSLVDVAPTVRGPRPRAAAELLVEIDRLRTRLVAEPPGGDRLPSLDAADPADPRGPRPAARTVGELIAAGYLRALPGHRIAAADIRASAVRAGSVPAVSGVQVLGVEELTGEAAPGSRTVDHLLLAGTYDAARLTEPGDVVFCTSPRPAAVVDRAGASVVLTPARVLRIERADPGGLVPDVLAADLSAAPARAREWRRFPVRRVPPAQRALVVGALDQLRAATESTRRRLADLDALTRLLTDGVTGGALVVHPGQSPTEGR